MELGFYLPTSTSGVNRRDLSRIARQAEEMGFGSLWVADHIVAPTVVASRYPFHPNGIYHNNPTGPYLEPLTALAFTAGISQHARLVVSVLVVPYRHPLATAKIAATVDVLSAGRLVLGVGAGWMAEEFAALGHEYFRRRGANTDEQLEIMQRAWTGEPFAFRGEFYDFDEVIVAPAPEQRPLPVWVGGHTDAALRRAVRFGTGANGNAGDLAQTARTVERLGELSAAAGRLPPDMTLRAHVRVAERPEPFAPGHLIGPPGYLAEALAGYAGLGVTSFGLDCRMDGIESMSATLDRLAPVLAAVPQLG